MIRTDADGKIIIQFDSYDFVAWAESQPDEHLDMLQQLIEAVRAKKRSDADQGEMQK